MGPDHRSPNPMRKLWKLRSNRGKFRRVYRCSMHLSLFQRTASSAAIHWIIGQWPTPFFDVHMQTMQTLLEAALDIAIQLKHRDSACC